MNEKQKYKYEDVNDEDIEKLLDEYRNIILESNKNLEDKLPIKQNNKN